MLRPKETVARKILADELDRAGWPAISTFTVESGKRPSGERLSWWHENTPANETAETARNLAYMRAYFRISGDGRLFAGGFFWRKSGFGWIDP